MLAAAALAALPAHSQAQTSYNWHTGNGNWSTNTNWSPIGVPSVSGDSASIFAGGTNSFTITYNYTGTAAILNSLTVDSDGIGTLAATLTMTANNLSAIAETIGGQGIGFVNQSGGANATSATGGLFIMGEGAGSTGNYLLSGTGTLSAGYVPSNPNNEYSEIIAEQGNANFIQTGGLNVTRGILELADASGSNTGTYTLSGTGSLSVGYNEIIAAFPGVGIFNQAGGTSTVADELIDGTDNGSGTYLLSAGTLVVHGLTGLFGIQGAEIITDGEGSSSFNQTGGSNITPFLQIDTGPASSTGSYYLGGTGLLSSNGNSTGGSLFEVIGGGGTGFFTQSGGTNNLGSSYLQVGNGATGTYTMSAGQLSAFYEIIGIIPPNKLDPNGPGFFNQSGGVNSSQFIVISESIDSYTLSGTGIVNISGTAGLTITGGTFNQSGGTVTNNGTLSIGTQTGTAAYLLSGTGALLENESEYIGTSATASFIQSGGTNTLPLPQSLYVGYNNGTGSYTLSGTGTLSARAEYVGGEYEITNANELAQGSFIQSGGLNSLGTFGLLTVGQLGVGTYNLIGGLLSTREEIIGGEFLGSSSFNQTGGTNLVGTIDIASGASYLLSGTGTLTSSDEILANGEGANFNQSGGAHTINGLLDIGSDGRGIYTLSGGTLSAQSIILDNGGGFTSTTMTVSNTGALSVTGNLQISTSDQFHINATSGSATVGSIGNSGTATVGSGGILTVAGNFTQTAGLTQIDGSLILTSGGAFDLNSGLLKGTGTITGPIFNIGGTVAPGDSPGQLNITGAYSQSNTSTLDLLLGGYSPGTQFSQLFITGSATLSGTMEVDLINGFTPQIGDQFTFLTATGGITGGFNTLTSNNGHFIYSVSYASGNVEISVTAVPEPAAMGVLGSSLFLLARHRCKSLCKNNL